MFKVFKGKKEIKQSFEELSKSIERFDKEFERLDRLNKKYLERNGTMLKAVGY